MLSDRDIRREMLRGRLVVHPEPRVEPNGLDLRVGPEYCRPRPGAMLAVTVPPPEGVDPPCAEAYWMCSRAPEDGYILLEPNSTYLIHTVEYIGLPDNIAGVVGIRSSMARLGLYVPVTYVDPGFQGQLTIELRTGHIPVRVRPGTPLVYLALFYLKSPAKKPYAGVYNGQEGVRHSKYLRRCF